MVNRKSARTLLRMGSGGQITLPSRVRKELSIKEGDKLTIRVCEGTIHLTPCKVVLRDLKDLVQRANPHGALHSATGRRRDVDSRKDSESV